MYKRQVLVVVFFAAAQALCGSEAERLLMSIPLSHCGLQALPLKKYMMPEAPPVHTCLASAPATVSSALFGSFRNHCAFQEVPS